MEQDDESLKRIIDSMDYEDLLRKWRFASSGDPFFQGEVGKYYREVMFKKKEEIGDSAAVRASKNIGWGD